MSKGKLLAVCLIWLVILGAGVLAWKLIFVPVRETAQEREQRELEQQREQQRQERIEQQSTQSRYRHQIDFHLDSFSGYAVLRSDAFKQELGNQGIQLKNHDDGADYLARIQALKRGDAQMAAFTIDALVKVCAELGELPATVVAIIDETTGADAIVAYKSTVPDVDALNRADTRFVLTPNSPSETLARVVMSRFELDNMQPSPFEEKNDAREVFERYKQAKPNEPLAYVLWQPYVSQMLKNPELHVVVDSSQFPSTIVDVIVGSGDFVVKNPDAVQDFVEAYLRTVYRYRDRADMLALVKQDAQQTGAPLSDQEATALVDGIWWKNTQENLAHMGFLPDKSLRHIEDMIANITEILQSTSGIARDPTGGHPNYLYKASVLEQLQDFHPGIEPEQVRDVKLPPLSEDQWKQLTPVGTARVPNLVFASGTADLTGYSRVVLDELADKLKTTRFYVLIQGNASRRGDPAQNKIVAEQRAKAAEQYLVNQGVEQNRIRAVAGEPSGTRSVSFVLGQLPY